MSTSILDEQDECKLHTPHKRKILVVPLWNGRLQCKQRRE